MIMILIKKGSIVLFSSLLLFSPIINTQIESTKTEKAIHIKDKLINKIIK